MPETEAATFIQGMYQHCGLAVPNDEQAIGEWTNRFACVRSRYTDGEVVVYTHGSSAEFDHLPLPTPIVDYFERSASA